MFHALLLAAKIATANICMINSSRPPEVCHRLRSGSRNDDGTHVQKYEGGRASYTYFLLCSGRNGVIDTPMPQLVSREHNADPDLILA